MHALFIFVNVIPAKAGIQTHIAEPGFPLRGNDTLTKIV